MIQKLEEDVIKNTPVLEFEMTLVESYRKYLIKSGNSMSTRNVKGRVFLYACSDQKLSLAKSLIPVEFYNL
jgi:hypothetical protein